MHVTPTTFGQVHFQFWRSHWLFDLFLEFSFIYCTPPHTFSLRFLSSLLTHLFIFCFLPVSLCIKTTFKNKKKVKVRNGQRKAAERAVLLAFTPPSLCNNQFCVCSLFAGEGESRREHRSLWVHLTVFKPNSIFQNMPSRAPSHFFLLLPLVWHSLLRTSSDYRKMLHSKQFGSKMLQYIGPQRKLE